MLASAAEGMIKRDGHHLFVRPQDIPRAKEQFAALTVSCQAP
jgi:hypothetical protein